MNTFKRHRVVMATIGSLGDLHPYLGLALARNARDIGSRLREENGAAFAVDLILDQLNERRANRLALRTVA